MGDFKISVNDDPKRILKERALALAREKESISAEGEMIEIVEFQLADELYAIESAYIAEVYPLKDLTPIPCTPPFVLGVINLRGRILPVIDLHTFFDLPNRGLSDLNKVIVLHNQEMEFGLLADRISGARWLPSNTLLPTLPTLTEQRAEYLLGVTPDRLIILDGGKILADSSIVVHEEV